LLVSIIGESQASKENSDLAEKLGGLLAQSGFTIVTGGLGGIMESVSRGAKKSGGTTIGILPGLDPTQANEWVDIPICTGLGDARNLIVVRAGFVVVAIGGAYGTLSEIGHALSDRKPVVSLNSWELVKQKEQDTGMIPVKTADEALNMVISIRSNKLQTG